MTCFTPILLKLLHLSAVQHLAMSVTHIVNNMPFWVIIQHNIMDNNDEIYKEESECWALP